MLNAANVNPMFAPQLQKIILDNGIHADGTLEWINCRRDLSWSLEGHSTMELLHCQPRRVSCQGQLCIMLVQQICVETDHVGSDTDCLRFGIWIGPA